MRIKNRLLILLAMLLCGVATTWAAQKVVVAPTQNGTVVVDNATPAAGATVTVTVTPDDKYQIAKSDIDVVATIDPGNAQAPALMETGPQVGMKIDLVGNDPENLNDERTYTFTMPAEPYNVLITAKFTGMTEFNITVDENIENGSVTVDKNKAVEGETVTLTATPESGYEVESYYYKAGGNTVTLTGNTFDMPGSDVVVGATFKKKDFTITLLGGQPAHGTVTFPATAQLGDIVQVTVETDPGYEVDVMRYDYIAAPAGTGGQGMHISDVIQNGQFTMPAADVTLTVTLKKKDFTITLLGGQPAHGTVTFPTTAQLGDIVQVTVETDPGYEVDVMKYDYIAAPAGTGGQGMHISDVIQNGQFTMPAADVTLTVTLKKSTYTVTVNPSENGTVFANPTSGTMGDEITLNITPAEGYEVDQITAVYGENNTPVEVTDNKFTMPAGNVTVTVTFKKSTYTVTVNPTENGTVFAEPTSGNMGDEITLNITPAEGYEVDQITAVYGENNTAVEVTDNKFTMPAGNVTVTVTFKKSTYTVTVNPTENGTVFAEPTSGNMGDEITLNITPAEGYEVDQITVVYGEDNTPVEVTDNKFNMPAGNVTVTVTFKKSTYTVTVNPSENGTVFANPTSGTMGDEITLTITPAQGYELESITVTGVNTNVAVAVTDGKFNLPADDVTVTATFKEIVHTYTVTGSPADLFGADNAWDPNNANGGMTLGEDGLYTWTSQPTFVGGDVEFKVVQDNSWDVCYPAGDNIKIEDLKPGTYTLTVTFNPETGEVTYNIVGQADVYVWGTINGNDSQAADQGVKMTSEDGKTYTASITAPDHEDGYCFFAFTHALGENADDMTTLNSSRFMAQSNGDFLVNGPTMNKELTLVYQNDAMMKIPAGEYTLTVDLENMKLTISGGTQLTYILTNGVEGVDYTVINDLAVVDRHVGTEQFFTSDGNDNWITIKAGDFFADATLMDALKGGYVSGVFSEKNQNPYLTLTVAPEEAEDATEVDAKTYVLYDEFTPKVDEVINVSKAYYKSSENTLRAYAPGAGAQGQSLEVDTSLFNFNFVDGHQYNVRGVINIKEPWNTVPSGISPRDYDFPFQNYKLLVLDVEETQIPTAIDDIFAEQGVKSVRYYNAAGAESTVPFSGVNIIVKEMLDGTKVTTKAIIK